MTVEEQNFERKKELKPPWPEDDAIIHRSVLRVLLSLQEEKDNLLFNLFFVLRKNNDIPKLIPSMCLENNQRESSYTAIIGKKFLNEGTKKQKWSSRDECALEFDSSLPLSPFKERNEDRSMAESESWSIARWDDAWSS